MGASLIYDATSFLRSERDQLRSIAAEQRSPTIIIYVMLIRLKLTKDWSRIGGKQEDMMCETRTSGGW
jgi:hypothetical protein